MGSPSQVYPAHIQWHEPVHAHAEHTKQGMAERLGVAEDRLARVMREDVMRSLAAAKLQLAQADFDILELQVPSLSPQDMRRI